MKDNDVYNFSYNDVERQKAARGWGGALDHCFDGQLIVKNGTLFDTYWGFDPRGDCGRRFTEAEALGKGTLTFVCNLDDVEKISEHLYPQYEHGDAFNLSHQHGCYKYFVVKKSVKKSVKKQLAILDERIRKAKSEADFAMRAAFGCIERCHELAVQLAAGEDVSV